MSDPLFEPIFIGRMEVPNRLFMPAMHLNLCREFQVTEALLRFYEARARGGAGMMTAGYAAVDDLSAHGGHVGAHRDDLLPGLSRLAAVLKEGGGRAALQLNHAGRYNHSLLLGGRAPVAPSAVPSRLTGETPRALDGEEIAGIIEAFARAAERVREAGFDAVEILAGTGYLISEFLSPLTNRREDEYGGSLENRMRFGLQVLEAVRAAVGGDFPLLVRLNGNDFMPGGNGGEDLLVFAERLVEAGADALNVNAGWHEARIPQVVTQVPAGAFAYLARRIRERVEVPVIAGHRINDPRTARKLIASGACDAVAMGRALIADPELPEKARSGREGEIVHCVACGQGCFDNLFRLRPVECLCNPWAGHEAETGEEGAPVSKRVMVVGGGPAGMSAALAAAERGHSVTLHEASSRLGGQLHLAGAPPGRAEFATFAGELTRQVEGSSIRVVLNSTVELSLVQEQGPDAVILATGGAPILPEIPGVRLPHVVQAWDVLSGKVHAGRRSVIIGGGAVGVETALFLAEEGGLSGETLRFLLLHGAESPQVLGELAARGPRHLVLVEMTKSFGSQFGKTTRWTMLQEVERCGVETRRNCTVQEITTSGVLVEGAGGEKEEILAETVILAVGTRVHNPLQSALENHGISHRVVGDALQPSTAFGAIHQGFAAGREI